MTRTIKYVFLCRLEEQAEAWHGPLSAALYVRRQEAEGPDWEATLVSIRYFAPFASHDVQGARDIQDAQLPSIKIKAAAPAFLSTCPLTYPFAIFRHSPPLLLQGNARKDRIDAEVQPHNLVAVCK
jgi:hypothetical protein